MEDVHLWLDDLDDLLFSLALVWERLRRVVLQVGLGAAFGLAGADTLGNGAGAAPILVCVAASSVAAWTLGAVARAYYYRARPTPA